MPERALLIIVPAYNEAANLPRVMAELSALDCADILIVDDGSTDETPRLIAENGWRAAYLRVNMGLACAVQTGMRYAMARGYAYAMQFDADGQHIADYVPDMLAMAQRERLDVVIGARGSTADDERARGSIDFRDHGARAAGSRLLSLAICLATGKWLRDPTSGMRLYAKRVIRLMSGSLNLRPEPDAIAYILRSGGRVRETPVRMRPREHGRSYLSMLGAVKYMLEMAFSILVLQPGRVKARLEEENE